MYRWIMALVFLVLMVPYPAQAQVDTCTTRSSAKAPYSYYFPLVEKGKMANKSALEQIESLVREPADFPFDGWALEIFPETATVKLIGTNQIKRSVLIPEHMIGKVKKGDPVKLGEHMGQPILLAVLPQLAGEVNYAGKGSIIPRPPAISVVATSDGWRVSWAAVPGADRYLVYKNDSPDETSPDEVGYVVGTSTTIPYESPYIYFAVRSVSGLNQSQLSGWLTDNTPPPVPDTFVALNDLNGHQLTLSPLDVAFTHVGLKCFEIQQANDESGTGAVSIGSEFALSSFPIYRTFGRGAVRYYRIRAIDWAGNTSDWTAWDYAYSGRAEIQDKFDGYGGTNLSPLETLYWLQIQFSTDYWSVTSPATMSLETMPPGWSKSPPSWLVIEPVPSLEGQAVKFTMSGGFARFDYSYIMNLAAENRFADDDYFLLAYYSNISSGTLELRFLDSITYDYRYTIINISAGGWNFVKVKKSDLLTSGSPDWSRIQIIGLINGSPSNGYVIINDLRFAKADPNNAELYSDVGTAWGRSVSSGYDIGEWHIYPGRRVGEPSKPFSYGQIKTATSPSVWYLSHKPLTTTQIYTGTIQTGLYLKGTNGQAGLAFYAKDVTAGSWDMYAIEANSSTDVISLVRWVGGTRTSIATASFTFAPDQILWLGADFKDYDSDGGRIKVFASLNEGNIIQAENLIISAQDTNVGTGGSVGLLSYQSNVRFVNFRAGSPEHAETADVAFALDGPILGGGGLIGEIKLWTTDTPPGGWFLCYGQAISRTTYASLFAVIGDTFGTGDGSTTFNLPDLRGRIPLGQDDMGGSSANRVTAAAADSIGGSGGSETHTLTTTEIPTHSHVNTVRQGASALGSTFIAAASNATGTSADANTNNTGGGGAHNNMPPYLALNFIIYAGV